MKHSFFSVLKLETQHRKHLLSEGFSNRQIDYLESIGVQSISESEARSLNIICRDDSGEYRSSSGIYFPFNGEFGQLRCDSPPIRQGKPAKYLTPCKKISRAWLPEGVQVVTEGFKDAAAGTLIGGIPTGAIAGVSHYRKALAKGSRLTILFDADGRTNPSVFLNLFNAALWTGGKIQLVPEISDQPKAGLCEYFRAGHTAEDYKGLINSALDPKDFLSTLPQYWIGLSREKFDQCCKAWFKLIVRHFSKDDTDKLIDLMNLDPVEYSALTIAKNIVGELRDQDKIEELASLQGGYIRAVTYRDHSFWDYLRLIEKFGDRLRFNELKKRVELDGETLSLDGIKVAMSIDHSFSVRSGKEDFPDVVVKTSQRYRYHPIKSYIERVSQQYGDDAKILENVADRYFGQSDQIYSAMLVRTMIGAIARLYQPGCKMDTALILQGAQGVRKSTFLSDLAGGAENFDDTLSGTDRDERAKLHQFWFIEWGEIESIFRKRDISAVKGFLTCRQDNIRLPYGRSTLELPRPSIIVGSTNQDDFLNDPTGARRYWVIPIPKSHGKIDIELLKKERDQLWAAAYALYKKGEQWHLTDLEEVQAAAIAKQFQSADSWELEISGYLESHDRVTVSEILSNALGRELKDHGRPEQMRVADILRRLGWRNTGRIDGKRCWVGTDLKSESIEPKSPTKAQGQVVEEIATPENLPEWATVGGYFLNGCNSPIKIVSIDKTSSGVVLIDPTGDQHLLAVCRPFIVPDSVL
ncbi:MAG: hypothetical protein KME18_16670 [Phormidium tanganyikae FI6-MK23]|jgi:predicted P-loop ATPase|nr:hypothetical protein [Phormidium tanganyikae FI6-MK23]